MNHDYTYYALESCLDDLKLLQESEISQMKNELQFMKTCLECGMILPVMEANTTDSFLGRIKVTIKKFFDAVVSLFRTSQKERMNKYAPVIKKYKSEIINNADNHTFEVIPFWEGSPERDYKKIETMINNAFNNMKNNKIDDFSFVKDFIDPKNIGNTNAVDMLKNYFRVGKTDTVELSTEVIKSNKLKQLAGNMVEYIISGSDKLVDGVASLKNNLDGKIDRLTPPTTTKIETGAAVTDGFCPDLNYHFIIEGGLTVDQTDLATLLNYSSVYEANDNRGKAFQNAANAKTEKKTEVTDTEGEKTSTTAVKAVKSEDGTQDDRQNKPEVKTTKDPEFEKYVTECIRIIKLIMSAYMTAVDERYLVYSNICLKILKSKYTLAKDDKGFYYVKDEPNNITNVSHSSDEEDNNQNDNESNKSRKTPKRTVLKGAKLKN